MQLNITNLRDINSDRERKNTLVVMTADVNARR